MTHADRLLSRRTHPSWRAELEIVSHQILCHLTRGPLTITLTCDEMLAGNLMLQVHLGDISVSEWQQRLGVAFPGRLLPWDLVTINPDNDQQIIFRLPRQNHSGIVYRMSRQVARELQQALDQPDEQGLCRGE